MPDDTTRHGIGGNAPPPLAQLRDYLENPGSTLIGAALIITELLPTELQSGSDPFMERIRKFATASKAWDERGDIQNTDQAEKAVNFGIKLKELSAEVDEWHGDVKSPFWDAGKLCDTAKNMLIANIVPMQRSMLTRVGRWQDNIAAEQKRRRDEAQKIADAAAQKARAAEQAGDLTAAVEQTARADAALSAARDAGGPARVRSESGGMATQRAKWTHEIKDPTDVPRQYCSPDPKKIKAAIDGADEKDGKKLLDIPGVLIFRDVKPQFR